MWIYETNNVFCIQYICVRIAVVYLIQDGSLFYSNETQTIKEWERTDHQKSLSHLIMPAFNNISTYLHIVYAMNLISDNTTKQISYFIKAV